MFDVTYLLMCFVFGFLVGSGIVLFFIRKISDRLLRGKKNG